jgi:hypothetical protein
MFRAFVRSYNDNTNDVVANGLFDDINDAIEALNDLGFKFDDNALDTSIDSCETFNICLISSNNMRSINNDVFVAYIETFNVGRLSVRACLVE